MRATVPVSPCDGKPQPHRRFAGSPAGLPHRAPLRQLARERQPALSYSAVGSGFGFPGPTLVPIARWYHAHDRQRVSLVMVPHSIDPDESFEGNPLHAQQLPTGRLVQGQAGGLPAPDHAEPQCGRSRRPGPVETRKVWIPLNRRLRRQACSRAAAARGIAGQERGAR